MTLHANLGCSKFVAISSITFYLIMHLRTACFLIVGRSVRYHKVWAGKNERECPYVSFCEF